jgi:hypothetical protein
MPDYLVFHAAAAEEVHQCAYALLKYLDVYNLNPPASHAVVIFTPHPAALDVYGSFFGSFDLREIDPDKPAMDCLRGFCEENEGAVLFLGENTYPVSALEAVFAGIAEGNVYAERQEPLGVSVLGFYARSATSPGDAMKVAAKGLDGYLAHYTDLKEFGQLLKDFFTRYQEESVPNQVKLMHNIDAAEIQVQKRQFLKLPLPVRLLKKLTGRGWRVSNYLRKI